MRQPASASECRKSSGGGLRPDSSAIPGLKASRRRKLDPPPPAQLDGEWPSASREPRCAKVVFAHRLRFVSAFRWALVLVKSRPMSPAANQPRIRTQTDSSRSLFIAIA
jgi:hypothetical protein